MTIIKIISDLHLNTKSKENDFFLDENLFIDYINTTLQDCEHLIIVGDLFETWESIWWKDHITKFNQICLDYPLLTSLLLNKIQLEKIIYVIGNHDSVVKRKRLIPNIQSKKLIQIEQVFIYIEHGHRADIFNSKISIVGKLITWMFSILERIGLTEIDNNIRRMRYMVPPNLVDEQNYIDYGKKLHEKTNADLIILGHTHKPCIKKEDVFYIINSGKCCDRYNIFDETTIQINENRFTISQQEVRLC